MPGTLDEVNCVSPTPTMSSSGGDGLQDSRDFKDYNGRSWSRNSRSSSALDRHSESSESLDNQSTSSGNGRQMQDFGSSEYIPTRSTKTAPKVAYNPMQFVKTGPTKLVQTAQEQLKKAEEVKKIREKKKDDAEDWQSNLEGWKSSRRKRQEHVIERVTEVKRMEQEEALKASEAAAKRLIGIREKRGKLSALYSVEDNDEIEFDSVNDSAGSDQQKCELEPITTEPSDPIDPPPPLSPDYSNSAIQDYVKFPSSSTVTSTSKQETVETKTRKEESVASRHEATKVAGDEETEKKKTPDNAELVVKRRSVFEREGSSSEQDKANAANRRSGEFSSTFKNRLSTFEITESSLAGGGRVAQPERDPNFKNKLANFHKGAASQEPEVKAVVEVVQEAEEKPNFKAKLAAFRQVEVAASSKPDPVKPAATAKPKIQETLPTPKVKPAVTATKPVVPPVKPAPSARQAPTQSQMAEPIYANSSVAMASSRSTPPAIVAYSPVHHPSADAESSDCTEDEGIRSLSPHNTPSPTSPTRTEAPEPLPPPLPSHPPVGYSPYSFQQQQQQQSESTAESSSGPSAWPPAEVVWDEWVDLGAVVQNAAPPSEKPPPPPSDEDIILRHSTTSTCTSTSTNTSAASIQQVTRRSANERNSSGTDAGSRQELRKRRSDFLGFDVNAMEDDAKEMADAIPPPPDLKSLLRNATDYRASDLGLAEWQPPAPKAEQEELLARKEREIIETLEKEEKERLRTTSVSQSHNRSQDSAEYEMTAEIDQLAREWQADTMLGPGWRSSGKFQSTTTVIEEPPKQQQHQQQQNLHVEVNPEVRTYPGSFMSPPSSRDKKPVQQQQQQQQLSPPKPSRLSAAPKPRLHDGEAWMAKRKVASEGGGARKDIKDVSRHWLIQEAEQRRIDAMQERNYSPSSSSSLQLTPPVRPSTNNNNNNNLAAATADGSHWMSRSSSSTSMDKMSELRLPKDAQSQSRSTSSLGSSPTPRPLYANQEEILEYADFTGAPHTAPPVWQVRSLVSSGSMDQLQTIHAMQPPSRPAKSQSQTLPSSTAMQQQYFQQQQQQQQQQSSSVNPAQTHQPSWRSTHPPETEKEPIAPLPHSVITTLTQRMTQRNNNNNANYGDYMNVQEATAGTTGPATTSRAGPQVPAQRPVNYRHPSVMGPSHSAPVQTTTSVQQQQQQPQQQNNNDRMLSVSGKKKCSLCQEELGRGAAMIIESLRLFYHINCFRCCVCGIALGNGTAGTDVRVRNNNLHCHDCYSNDDGLKFSKV